MAAKPKSPAKPVQQEAELRALRAMKGDLQTMVEHLVACEYTTPIIKSWISEAHWLRIAKTYDLHREVYHGANI